MRALYVPIPDERARRALIELAEREFRDPRDQAALLVVEGLRRAGALTDDPSRPAARGAGYRNAAKRPAKPEPVGA